MMTNILLFLLRLRYQLTTLVPREVNFGTRGGVHVFGTKFALYVFGT